MAVRYAPIAQSSRDDILTHTRVTGGGGVQLHVVEGGNRAGRPILFIHGFSQSWLCWDRQMQSDLANEFRLVALDLRGHGESDKPHDGYSDCRLWADDIDAVIREVGLQQPLLCGWSYGSLVILDYIRQYGENAIGGIAFGLPQEALRLLPIRGHVIATHVVVRMLGPRIDQHFLAGRMGFAQDRLRRLPGQESLGVIG